MCIGGRARVRGDCLSGPQHSGRYIAVVCCWMLTRPREYAALPSSLLVCEQDVRSRGLGDEPADSLHGVILYGGVAELGHDRGLIDNRSGHGGGPTGIKHAASQRGVGQRAD